MMRFLATIAALCIFIPAPCHASQRPGSGDEWAWDFEHTRTPSHFRYASHGRWYSFSHGPFCEAKDVYGNLYCACDVCVLHNTKWRRRHR